MTKSIKKSKCRMCKSADIHMFLQLGPQPLAGKFLRAEQLNEKDEYYPLDIFFCKNCKLVQVLDIIPPEILFSEYFYAPHNLLSPHFVNYANEIANEFNLRDKSFVAEIGSNIGMMLKPFKELGIKAIGIEPAKNLAKTANEMGLETVNDFFTAKVATDLVKRVGKADLIIANNVFAHIDDLDEIMKGVKILLKDNGVFVFENHYLVDTLEKLQYDDIYHEHLCYYSLHPLITFFEQYEMNVYDAKIIQTHGGSIRVYCSNSDRNVKQSVYELLELEKKLGVDTLETYIDFAKKVQKNKAELTAILKKLKSEGKSIVGYGAPARGNTLLNYCKIDTKILDYIIDDSPLRQNKYTPGTRIPIFSVEKFREDNPDYAFLLAWGGYTEKILQKEKNYTDKGGKFIIPMPKPTIVP